MLSNVLAVGLLGVSILALPGIMQAAPITFKAHGTFANDNDVSLITFEIIAPTTVDIRTVSYAMPVKDGFDPLLTLFSGTGPTAEQLESNDDGCAGPGSCLNASILRGVDIGFYTLAITQAANLSFGALGDGFLYDSDPHYTANLYPGTIPSTNFWDSTGTQRTGYWEIEITADNAIFPTAVPEPASWMLVQTGALVVLGCMRLRRMRSSRH